MADAVVLHNQNVTENTATSTTFVNGATIAAASFVANKEYLIIAVCNLKPSGGTTDCGFRIVHGATPTAFTDAGSVMDPAASDERRNQGWLFRFTQPGTTEDVTVQFNLNTGAGTVTHMFSSIIAIKLSDDFTENTDYYWNEATGDVSDATSMTDRAATTFTPNGTDHWLLIGQASWDIASTGVNFAMRIHDSVGPTNYGDDGTFGYPSQDATNDLYNFLYFVAATPSNASHTFSVQTISNASQTVRSTRIIAINLSKFAQDSITYTAASDAPSTGGVWETEATLSPTPTATGDWVVLANALVNAAAADNILGRLQINPSGGGLASDPAYGDDAPDNIGSSASRGLPFNLITLKSLSSGASRAINFDFTQAGTGTVRERALVAFPVALAAAGGAMTGSASGVTTQSGLMAGAGALIGALAGLASPLATLIGQAAISGATANAATLSGVLTGAGALVGSSAGLATQAGMMAGSGALVGSSAGNATQSGTFTGAGALAGSATGSATVSGTLAAPSAGDMSGAANGAATQTGTLAGAGALVGASAGIATQSGVIAGAGELAGSISSSATQNGTLTGAGELAGSSTGSATPTGALTGIGSSALSGSAAGLTTLAGTLAGSGALIGAAAGAATQNGSLTLIGYINGASAGQASLVATLTASGVLTGQAIASATASALITAEGILMGTVAGLGAATGTLIDMSFFGAGTRTVYLADRRVIYEPEMRLTIEADRRVSVMAED